jgi:6-methylsalicylate decarboxylase
MPGSIDVHAHFLPDLYRAELLRHGHEEPDGFPSVPEWSADEHVASMDRQGIERAFLSISSPGVRLAPDADVVSLCRAVNEEGRKAVVDHPGRFGLFASLPLPDVDAALAEIAHSAEELRADGFALLTHVGGAYLGDASFAPVWDELDRRSARVFVHPTSPPCFEQVALGRPRPMIEFLFDTTRTVVDLVLSGTLAAHPNVEVIVPHGGATLPMVADRVAVFCSLLEVDEDVDVLRDLARLHFDLAGYPLPRQLDALLTMTCPEHLHYGSDYPFTPELAVERARARLADVDAGALSASLRANTERLFPHLGDLVR